MAVFFPAFEAVSSVASACFQQTGLWLEASNAVAGAAAFLRRKDVPKSCRQNQPEHRLVLLSASPHPPFTAPS